MVPWAHPSRHLELRHDRFSQFCMARGLASAATRPDRSSKSDSAQTALVSGNPETIVRVHFCVVSLLPRDAVQRASYISYCTAMLLVVIVRQFRQMLSDELTMQNAESSTDEGVTAYITQTFLGNCARPFVKRFALCYQTVCLSCLSCLPCL